MKFLNCLKGTSNRFLVVASLLISLIFPILTYGASQPKINPYLSMPSKGNVGKNAYTPFISKSIHSKKINKKELGEHFYLKLSPFEAANNQSSSRSTKDSKKALQQVVNRVQVGIGKVLLNASFQLTPVYNSESTANVKNTQPTHRKTSSRWYKLTVQGNPLSDSKSLQLIATLPEVDYIEQEVLFNIDPHSSVPKHVLNNVSSLSNNDAYELSEQWYLNDIKAPQVWQHLEDNNIPAGGSPDVIVAVIDTGVDYLHPDLINNLWINHREIPNNAIDDDFNGIVDDIYGANFIGESAHGDPKDDNGHGTHVSGIIAAEGDNGIGIKGIAHNVKVMNIKAAQYSGILTSGAIVAAINYAVMNGADVINMSFGGSTYSRMVEEALANAYTDSVLVASAGNNGRYNDRNCGSESIQIYPAVFNWVIAAMAKNQTPSEDGEYLSSFSNWDCTPSNGFEYELMVPGANILSTVPNGGYAQWDGTSMAAPMITSMAALARSKWPDKTSYNSRFIAGQLVATGSSQLGIIHNEVNHFYQTLNGLSALEVNPQPSLSYHSRWLFDDTAIEESNDGDGRPDSGELINLGLVIHNHWGNARNVEVTLIAQTPLGQDSPYIEMITDTVSYGDLGSFSNQDNGFIDNDGQITGVSAPFQFRVAVDTPNDMVIPVTLRMTANNGFDVDDSNDYIFTNEQAFNLQVQRGTEFPIFISEDMTLTKDRLWIINQPSLIQAGVTLTVEPGTQIQFHSSDLAANQQDDIPAKLSVQGDLILQGSINEPIELFPSELKPQYEVRIESLPGGTISMDHVNIMNPMLLKNDGTFNINHGYLTQHAYEGIWAYDDFFDRFSMDTPNMELDTLKNSRLNWLGQSSIGVTFIISTINGSLIENSAVRRFYNGVIEDSVLLTNVRTADGLLPMNSIDFVASAMSSIGYEFNEKVSLLAINPQIYDDSVYTSVTNLYLASNRFERFDFMNQYANFLGGSIAIINDQQEMDNISHYLKSNSQDPNIFDDYDCGLAGCDQYFGTLDTGYIGLTDLDGDGNFNWVDGSEVTYKPTDFHSNGEFVFLRNGAWFSDSWLDVLVLELPTATDIEQLNSKRVDFIAQYFNSHNAFLNRWWDESAHWQTFEKNLFPYSDHFGERYSALANNYWGTNNLDLIENSVLDYFDGHFDYNKIIYQPILIQPSSDTYPFVTNVQLSTASQSNVTEVGSDLVTFTVYFNRDMDQSKQPQVNFGPAAPLMDYRIDGDWQDARTWVGNYKMTPLTGDGYQYLRVSGARAIENAWLVIGNDIGRFRFNISTNTTDSMQLTATSETGYIHINWNISQHELLHGVNLYRADTLDGEYIRIVQYLLTSNETSYQDHSVIEAQQYFYKISQVHDGRESEMSDAVSSTAKGNLGLGELSITDANLAACIVEAAEVNNWTQISQIINLTCAGQNISDLTGLESFTGLVKLDLRRNQLTEIAALNSLTALTELKLSKNQINDITGLFNLKALTFLSISSNDFDQGMLSVLSGLNQLHILYLRDNHITDIRPLSHLSQLTQLYLKGNQINDITSAFWLSNLLTLQLNNNQITDVSALFHLTNATSIDLRSNNEINCIHLNALDMMLGAGVVKRPELCVDSF